MQTTLPEQQSYITYIYIYYNIRCACVLHRIRFLFKSPLVHATERHNHPEPGSKRGGKQECGAAENEAIGSIIAILAAAAAAAAGRRQLATTNCATWPQMIRAKASNVAHSVDFD